MDSLDPARATLSQWTGSLDDRGLASFRELAMARSPLRRLAYEVLPGPGHLPRAGDELLAPEGPGPRSRPGKRW